MVKLMVVIAMLIVSQPVSAWKVMAYIQENPEKEECERFRDYLNDGNQECSIVGDSTDEQSAMNQFCIVRLDGFKHCLIFDNEPHKVENGISHYKFRVRNIAGEEWF